MNKIKIGDQVNLLWHGSDDWLRVLYIWADELTLLDFRGKPIQVKMSYVKEITSAASVGMYLVTPVFHEAENNQFLIAGFFNGAYWRLSEDIPIVAPWLAQKYASPLVGSVPDSKSFW